MDLRDSGCYFIYKSMLSPQQIEVDDLFTYQTQENSFADKNSYCGSASSVCCPDGRYTTFRDLDSFSAISSAASIFLSSMRPSPPCESDVAISLAPNESPSALMMLAIFCCSACPTVTSVTRCTVHIIQYTDVRSTYLLY